MADLDIRITGLAELRRNFRRAPQIGTKLFERALIASLFAIEKQANDGNFQFKTPRAQRTGYLGLSFKLPGARSTNGLVGRIGPTAEYAPYVYFGTSRGIQANPYMDRIAKASEPEVGKIIADAASQLASEIAKI